MSDPDFTVDEFGGDDFMGSPEGREIDPSKINKIPAILQHSMAVYNAMLAQAIEDDQGSLLFEGFTTKLMAECGLPTPYYSQIMNLLKSLKCVEQFKRGGGGAPSVWVLYNAPTVEAWVDLQRSPDRAMTTQARLKHQGAAFERVVRDLTETTNRHHGELVGMVHTLEARIRVLEAALELRNG